MRSSPPLLALVVVAALAVACGGGTAELSSGREATTAAPAPEASPITTMAAPATTAPATNAATTTTARAPVDSTIATTVPVPTTTTASHPPVCTKADATVAATADKPAYTVGEDIILRYTAAKVSGGTCLYPRFRTHIDTFDAAGNFVRTTSFDNPSPGAGYPDLPEFYYLALTPGSPFILEVVQAAGGTPGTSTYRFSTKYGASSAEMFGTASVTRTIAAA